MVIVVIVIMAIVIIVIMVILVILLVILVIVFIVVIVIIVIVVVVIMVTSLPSLEVIMEFNFPIWPYQGVEDRVPAELQMLQFKHFSIYHFIYNSMSSGLKYRPIMFANHYCWMTRIKS